MQTPLTALERELLGYVERLATASETSAQALRALGLEVHRGLAGTGVVGTLRGRGPRAGDPFKATSERLQSGAWNVLE